MRLCTGLLLASAIACKPAQVPPPVEPKPPVPTVDIAPDWVIVHEERTHLILRWRDSADGVRIQLSRELDREPGISPIVSGKTYSTTLNGRDVPMFSPAWPERDLTAATIERKGPDLLVRLEGVPLSELSAREEVPDDAMLSWLRIRHRGDTLRLVARGLFVWTLPSAGLHHDANGLSRVTHTEWGDFTWRDTALPVWTSSTHHGVWQLDSSPTLDVQQPYERVGITWQVPARPLSP